MVPKSEAGLETDLGGIYLVTSAKSLTPGPVPAAEPRELPWLTPEGPVAQQKNSLLLLFPCLFSSPPPVCGKRQTSLGPQLYSLKTFQQDTGYSSPKPRRSSLSQEIGEIERLSSGLENLSLIYFTAAPAPKQFRRPRRKQTLSSHCPVSARCEWGAGGVSQWRWGARQQGGKRVQLSPG